MKQVITYTYRIYPNKQQQKLINKTFESCRIVYNTLLNSRKIICKCFKNYEDNCKKQGIRVNRVKFNSLNKEPSIPKIKERFPELKDVDSLALCTEWNNLNKAFKNFYSKRAKFPKFKTRNDKNTYTTSRVNNNIRIQGSRIRLPKIGMVKVKLHREMPKGYEIKRVVVKKDKCDRYYVAIIINFENENDNKIDLNKSVGFDFKIGNIFVSSDNYMPDESMPYNNFLNKLKKIQRIMNKKRKFSKNWLKILSKFRKIHTKIVNIRKDFLHKCSKKISGLYDFVAIETIDLKSITKNLNNSRSLYDTAYYSFISKLKYKLELNGKIISKINKWFPSSKRCSVCGNIKKYFALSTKIYFCNKCHSSIDRDYNAAINIKNEALKMFNT